MNILMFSDADFRYGVAHSLAALIRNLQDLDNNLKITVVYKSDHKNNNYDLGDRCSILFSHFCQFNQIIPFQKWKKPIKMGVRFIEYHIMNPICIANLEKAIDLQNVDIIHTASSRVDIGAVISEKYKIPHVWHLREFYNLDFPCCSLRPDFIRYMDSHTDRFIAVSNAIKDHWANNGLNQSKISTVYNGVDINSHFRIIEPDGVLSDDSISCVLVGSLSVAKGHMEIIRALKTIKDSNLKYQIHVDFIGDGKKDYKRYLRKIVNKYELEDYITFRGYMDNPSGELRNYDIALMLSRSEGFGRVTAEYMMAGLPVIATDSGANPELIRDEVDGLLYKYGDHKALAERILRLAQNKTERYVMGRNGRVRAMSMFTTETNAKNILSLYEAVIRGNMTNKKTSKRQ